jgi:cytochrome c oxidase assembly factor CtaG
MDSLFSLCLASVPATPERIWYSWSLAPETFGPLLLAAFLYAATLIRGRKFFSSNGTAIEAGSFAIGLALLVVGLVSPLCRMAATVAWAHMVQHLLLVALAPLFLVLGARPLRDALRKAIQGNLPGAARWRVGLHPTVAAALYGIGIWFWHIPALYQASLLSTAGHLLMYGSLLLTAWLFWAGMFGLVRTRGQSPAMAVVILLITIIHTGLLGALLTFAPAPWYPLMQAGAISWGLAPLEDQQLAGLIMWVPMGFIYLFAALVIVATALNRLRGPLLPRFNARCQSLDSRR